MRIPRLYHQGELTQPRIKLTESAGRHAVQVLRLPINARVILFNGDGQDYQGKIVSIKKQVVEIEIVGRIDVNNESALNIELGIAIIKSDRMDFAIQKATELGVSSVTPLITDFSSINIKKDKQEKKLNHWQGVIQHACEQSGRACLPVLNPIMKLDDWLEHDPENTLVLNPLSEQTLSELDLKDRYRLCIGPEGGFSDKELEKISASGIKQIRMGPRILRAETAAISGLVLLQNRFGDLI